MKEHDEVVVRQPLAPHSSTFRLENLGISEKNRPEPERGNPVKGAGLHPGMLSLRWAHAGLTVSVLPPPNDLRR